MIPQLLSPPPVAPEAATPRPSPTLCTSPRTQDLRPERYLPINHLCGTQKREKDSTTMLIGQIPFAASSPSFPP